MYIQVQQPRIIRFGENEEDVFLLKKDDTRRVALVEKLKRDPLSPGRWLELLKCPTSYEAKLYSKVRLYRRATSLMQKENCRHNTSYVEIWILFAKLKGCVLFTTPCWMVRVYFLSAYGN